MLRTMLAYATSRRAAVGLMPGCGHKRNRSCRSVQIISVARLAVSWAGVRCAQRDRRHSYYRRVSRGCSVVSLRGKLRFVGGTDTGKVREHNEDTIAFDADIGLLVLADGMGGYNAGEVASGIAVKTIVNLVRDAVEREDLSVRDPETGFKRPPVLLRDAIHRANKI